MSTTSTAANTFDLRRFVRATEERDASTQLSMYAPEAIVTVVDPTAPPRSPRIISGRDQIKDWVEQVTSRDMTHAVGHTVADEHGAAFTVNCRYPDGTRVLCSAVLELEDSLIARETVVQVWDQS